jgi:hypothetical protein
MRPISEAGELGDRLILLNKPRKTDQADTSAADTFLNGEPGETISLGEDRAAILITKKNGGSLHRVALLDLKHLQLDSIVTTMSRGEQARIVAGRWLEALAIDALAGAAEGAIGAGAGIPPPNMFVPIIPGGLVNESLAAAPDGRSLYVLDTDIHKVLVVDVPTSAITGRIPMDDSVTAIQIASGGKHLICSGAGLLKTVDLESTKLAAN